jgi:Na+/proline symporter
MKGAAAGMVGGFLTTVIWTLAFKEMFYDLLEVIPGFIVGFILTLGISRATSESRESPEPDRL